MNLYAWQNHPRSVRISADCRFCTYPDKGVIKAHQGVLMFDGIDGLNFLNVAELRFIVDTMEKCTIDGEDIKLPE